MSTLAVQLRHAARSLARSPGLFVSATLLLALGIGATTAIYSVVSRVLLDPLPYEEPERLVMIWGELQARNVMHFPESPPNLEDMRRHAELFEDIGGVISFGNPWVRDGGEPRQLTSGIATWNFLSLLGVEPLLGRGFTPADGAFNASEVPPGTEFPNDLALPPRSTIISHRLWQQEFGGDAGAVGKIVEIGGAPVEIVGVLPPDFRLHMPAAAGVAADIDLWVPVRANLAAWPRNNVFLQLVGRLKEGVTVAQAQAEIDAIGERLADVEPTWRAAGTKKWVRPFEDELTADVGTALWALLGAASFVLLIACANVANLLLVRAAGKSRELSVRAALGAGRGALVRGMLLEAGVLAAAGAVVGTLLAMLGLEIILRSAPDNIARLDAAGIDPGILLFTTGVAALTTLLAGLLPALHGSRLRVAEQLKERTGTLGTTGAQRRLRTGLVIGEIALSFVLLVGTGLMVRSFVELGRTDPGFEPDGLLTFQLNLPLNRYQEAEDRNAFYKEFQERLAGLPGVVSVSGVTPLPLSGQPFNGRYSADATVDETSSFRQAQYRLVLPGYFETMGLDLVAGRTLTRDDDENARPYVVVDETLAQKAWPGLDPLGRRVWARLGQEMSQHEVVGVVRHEVQDSLHETPRETIYFPNRAAGGFAGINFWALRTAVAPSSLVPQVKAELAAMDPRVPLADVRPMRDYLADAMSRTRFALQLVGAFGVAALVIAAIGLYAVVHYAVRQRRAEIGVRMSFGAAGRDIFALFLRHGLALAASGLLLGGLAALGLSRGLGSFLVGVSAHDPLTYVAAAVLFALVALVASVLPSWRASRVQPMRVLREE
jgi:putative ABC transport system permease protein